MSESAVWLGQKFPLWVCDNCGDWAEVEPGGECEVCCEGTIQVVQCVPEAELSELRMVTETASAFTFFPGDDAERFHDAVAVERTHWGFAPYPNLSEWAVRRMGRCLNRDGEWEWEPQPSGRDEEFLVRCRFERDDAIRRARTVLRKENE